MSPGCLGRGAALAVAIATASCGGSNANPSDDICRPDADGVIGGDKTLDVTVDDDGFSPSILTAQNLADVTLTVHNAGTRPHNFVTDCMPTPNDNGCPLTSCFPLEASILPIAPGASGSAMFAVPRPEGIYYYHSSIVGDATVPCTAGAKGCGQFIVK
jgi:hypothetical protein